MVRCCSTSCGREPGATLSVPAGAPHSYLSGTGVEIIGQLRQRAPRRAHPQAGRGGGTAARRRRAQPSAPQARRSSLGGCEVGWRPEAPEFQLTRLRLTGNAPVEACQGLPGPQIVLDTAGTVTPAMRRRRAGAALRGVRPRPRRAAARWCSRGRARCSARPSGARRCRESPGGAVAAAARNPSAALAPEGPADALRAGAPGSCRCRCAPRPRPAPPHGPAYARVPPGTCASRRPAAPRPRTWK